MAGQLNKYKVSQKFVHWKGMTKDNHLAHISELFEADAQKGSNHMVRLFASRTGCPSYEAILNDYGIREFEDDKDIRWKVLGATERNIPLVEARDENGVVITDSTGANIGQNNSPFELVFAEDWFERGEWIVGNLNEQYPMRILEQGRQEGVNTVYRVELLGNIAGGIPRERLLRGEKFSVESTYVERELSREVGTVRFAAPVSMRNDWTTIRLKAEVSGKQVLDKIAVSIPVVRRDLKTGKLSESHINHWMQYVDYEFEQQFAGNKNRALVYGRSNRNDNGEYLNVGDSGEVIRIGAGLREQMEFGYTRFYNEFSIDLLEDALEQIFSNNNTPFNETTVHIHTGRRGAIEFNKAVQERLESSGWQRFQFNGDSLGIISKASSPIHKNALKAGYQFTEYIASNNLHLILVVDSIYDDPYRNKIMHPKGGVAESYRFDIMDMGPSEEANIVKCRIAGEFGNPARGYQSGMRNPFTKSNSNNYMSWDIDSAKIHKMETFGVVVYDPTRCFSLIPSILQG